MGYYDALKAKWPELGAPSMSDADVAALRAAAAAPRPDTLDGVVTDWVNPQTAEQRADAKRWQDYYAADRAWHQAWASMFVSAAILAKLEVLNAPTPAEVSTPTGRFFVSTDQATGRQIMEPEYATSTQTTGPAWWETHGYSGPITGADLESIFVKEGEVLS